VDHSLVLVATRGTGDQASLRPAGGDENDSVVPLRRLETGGRRDFVIYRTRAGKAVKMVLPEV
jgi:hypothetical protein